MPQRTKTLSTFDYILGLIVIFGGVYSQYFIHGFGVFPQLILVYGIPVLAVSWLLGRKIGRRAFHNTGKGMEYGMAYFGIFVVLSYLATVFLISLFSQADPGALIPLNKALPFNEISPGLAWIMVAVSMILIGPAEEYLFRGFVFGGLLRIFQGRHWIALALVSSVLFALAHAYYLIIFGLASVIFFLDIVAVGMALAFAYYFSRGNLVAPALLHGFFDATAFLNVATGSNIGLLLRLLLIIFGLLLAFYLAARYLLSSTGNTQAKQ